MKVLDFNGQFEKHVGDWLNENRSKYKNADLLESAVMDEYIRWINRPAKWLDGDSPATYYNRFDDARELVDLMLEHMRVSVPVPDQLLERIKDLKGSSDEMLVALALDALKGGEARVTAINLLIEMESVVPADKFLDIIASKDQPEDVREVASELVAHQGSPALIELIIERLEGADAPACEAFIDILCNFPGDERIYSYTVREFLSNPERCALYAALLGKLGDGRAIEHLRAALEWSEINYLDYVEVVNAIEALGGEVSADREFAGDPYYESLKGLV